MREYVVRLSSLTVKNIKNVKKGTIFMPLAKERKLKKKKKQLLKKQQLKKQLSTIHISDR